MNNSGNNKPAQNCTDMASTQMYDAENFIMKFTKSPYKSVICLFVILLCFAVLVMLFFPEPCHKTNSNFTSDLFGSLSSMMFFVFSILYERRYLIVALKDRLIMRGFTVVEVQFSDIASCKIVTKRFENIFLIILKSGKSLFVFYPSLKDHEKFFALMEYKVGKIPTCSFCWRVWWWF